MERKLDESMGQKKKTEKYRKNLRRLSVLILGICFMGIAACGKSHENAQEGEKRKADPEEIAFFQEQVERNVSDLSEEELEKATLQYMNEVNAVYWMGSELGICDPFDFSQLQKEWKEENQERESKEQSGEVYYGPDSLSLDVYFPYKYSALQSDIVREILDHRDEELVEDARKFYEENPEAFTKVTAVTYQSTVEGETTEYTITSDQFRAFGQSNPQLMDFLAMAEDGDEITINSGATEHLVKKLGVTTEKVAFEENERTVVEMFLSHERFAEWIQQIAEKHGVEF